MGERTRRLQFLRMSLLLQAAGLFIAIALTVPDFVESRLHPQVCTWLCLDRPGIIFALCLILLAPPGVLLLLLAWRWRGASRWPLVIVAVIDTAAIALVAIVIISFVQTRQDMVPTVASAPPLLLLPALTTVALGVNVLWPVPWKHIFGLSLGGSIVLGGFLWLYAIRPVHQRIPGDLALPLSATIVYEGRDLGCRDYRSWIPQHVCLKATLVVYRGSGDPSQDQATINEVLLAQKRTPPGYEQVLPLPVDLAVNRTDSLGVDPTNAGACLIIIDRVTVAPSPPKFGACGTRADYADIRSHWPSNDAYAIGIIYNFSRPDYLR